MSLRRSSSEFRTEQIVFVGQQDGPPERELKSRLVELFDGTPNVRAAYLAQVRYGDNVPIAIALCLCLNDVDGTDVVESASAIFAEMFGNDSRLDIVPIDKKQEVSLSRVCSAFYFRSGTAPHHR